MDEIPRMWWKPADDRGPACLSVEVNGAKRFQRVWFDDAGGVKAVEWGWSLSENSLPLVASDDR